jgi:hypothetical protein
MAGAVACDVTVGRSSKASEQLKCTTCSGLHAIIVLRRGDAAADDVGGGSAAAVGSSNSDSDSSDCVCLRDLHSMHRTYVDGVKATSDTWTLLKEGSTVTFGDMNAPEDDCAKYKLCRCRFFAFFLFFSLLRFTFDENAPEDACATHKLRRQFLFLDSKASSELKHVLAQTKPAVRGYLHLPHRNALDHVRPKS